MEVAGPLGTPLGLAQRKRASPRGDLVVPAVLSVLKRLGIASVTIHRQLAKAGHEMPCGHKKVKKWGLPWCSGV